LLPDDFGGVGSPPLRSAGLKSPCAIRQHGLTLKRRSKMRIKIKKRIKRKMKSRSRIRALAASRSYSFSSLPSPLLNRAR
jgi:hypothetical protein